MIKKIISVITFLLIAFVLVSCSLINSNDKVINEYNSTSMFESKMIKASNEIKSSNVSLIDTNFSSSRSIGGAVVVKREDNISVKKYYAITSASNLVNISNTYVFINNSSLKLDIIDYAISDIYDIGLFSFETRVTLKPAKIFDNDKIYDFNIGEAALAIGSSNNLDILNSVKDGFITNKLENDVFTHDADINMGEIGSGIYNLSGYLIGINYDKIFKDENISSEYNILGLNYGYSVNRFANVVLNIDKINFKSKIIYESLFTTKIETKKDDVTDLETAQNQIYQNAFKSLVTIEDLFGNRFSGILIRKTGNKYQIATKFFLSHTGLKVNDKYLVTKTQSSFMNLGSILEIVTSDNLEIYDETKNPFITKNMDMLVKGQKVLAIGSVSKNLQNQLNTGNLSRVEYKNSYTFMHDAKTNLGQIGAPIFNLNGQLIGINSSKENIIETQTGNIAAEGLTYGLNISYLVEDDVTFTNYESTNEYEQSIIDVVKNVDSKVVTVKTNSGHGSGVIYKKEKNRNNVFTYYVMTNSHVVEGSSEITISFSDSRKSIRAKDYYNNDNYDLGVVRFESTTDFENIESDTLNNISNEQFIIGQTTIAIGTPADSDRSGYVTRGIVGNSETYYGGISKLAIRHNSTLNPGNSGGPLFNLKGDLIAINVAKETNYFSKTGLVNAERVSISLNINSLSSVINNQLKPLRFISLEEHTPRLGITVVKLSDFLDSGMNNSELGDATYGIVVIYVDDLFDAYGKLQLFDVIISINGSMITSNEDVVPFVSNKPAGTKLLVEVIRKGEVNPIVIEVLIS